MIIWPAPASCRVRASERLSPGQGETQLTLESQTPVETEGSGLDEGPGVGRSGP